MKLRSISFSATDFARFLNVTPESVSNWCRNGALRITLHDGPRYTISGRAASDFLYTNPKYRKQLEGRFLNGLLKEKQEAILDDIRDRPLLYSTSDVCELLSVDRSSIKNWVRREWIAPIDVRPVYGEKLFTQAALQKFIREHPKYKKRDGKLVVV